MSDGDEIYVSPPQDITEKLMEIATTKRGSPIPKCMRGPDNPTGLDLNGDWGTPLSAICREAAEEIERLRDAVRRKNR